MLCLCCLLLTTNILLPTKQITCKFNKKKTTSNKKNYMIALPKHHLSEGLIKQPQLQHFRLTKGQALLKLNVVGPVDSRPS